MTRFAFAAIMALAAVAVAPSAASAQGLGSLFSCDAQGSSNTTGAVVGGLVGALAGSQVSKNERTLGAVIGAGLGAAIGNNIGCRMDRKAQQDARVAFQRALETGKTQSWSDPQTGASGRISVLGPVSGSSTSGSGYAGRWRYAQGVTVVSRVSTAGGEYAGAGRVNVRAAPNTSAPVVDRLQPNETFEVAGAVAGGWLAVVEDGFIQGYVARSVVQPVGGGADGGCRLVEQTVNERGQPAYRERFNACRDSSGEWRLTAA
ncbi:MULTISPECIES: glycine zipper 2TM domain-containing protein [unclassified Phenylobacterium]|uniref:glycine zipper domain-containing protein n=1 Tax=unclassified Phenylobacterium TaxID=2640670 RepID=UPI00083A8EA0|nr:MULTISPECIES: glycine zipper 2TM domain-containing protein [unclassified Phenylobacterium]